VTDERSTDRVRLVLRLLAEHLERHLEGDPRALEALGGALEDPALTPDDLLAATWVLRSLENVSWSGEPAGPGTAPGPQAQRVLSAEERESLGPEAWGYLLDLKRRGALDHGQFERVLDVLADSGMRPVSLALARDVAARVVLQLDPEASGETPYGDHGLTH